MEYRELQPGPRLVPFVRCYWSLEDPVADVERAAERIVPDGCMEIVFNLADPFTGVRDGAIERRPSVLVVGEVRRHVMVRPAAVVELFGVRFHPGGAYPFLGVPAAEIEGSMQSLDVLWGAFADEAEERLRAVRSMSERAALVESMLIARLDEAAADRGLSAAVAMIERSGGTLAVRDIADALGVGQRALERRFQRSVGIAPKAFARIVRFQRIFRSDGVRSDRRTWADVALECGYFDQAHFIHDFKEFSGVTPEQFFAAHNRMSDHFTGLS